MGGRTSGTRKGNGAGYGGPKRGEGNQDAGPGRPEGLKTGEGKKARAAEIAKDHVRSAMAVWLTIMRDAKAPAAARIAAAAHMVERAEGKAVQPTEDLTHRRAEDMTDDELADIAAGSGQPASGAEGRPD